MIAIQADVARISLCPVHFTRMRSSKIPHTDPVSYEHGITHWFRCTEVGCRYRYSLASGYFKFREGEPIESEESLRGFCPTHREPLYISEYDSQSGIATWRCPVAGCETHKKSRQG